MTSDLTPFCGCRVHHHPGFCPDPGLDDVLRPLPGYIHRNLCGCLIFISTNPGPIQMWWATSRCPEHPGPTWDARGNPT